MAKCERSDCDDRATAYLLTQGKYAQTPEPRDTLCRTHYVEDRRADGAIVACETLRNGVTLRDVSGGDVDQRGQRVEFDADETNVDLLVRCGFVKRLDGPSLVDVLASEELAIAARLAHIKSRLRDAEVAVKAEKAAAAKAAKAKDAKSSTEEQD